MAELTGFWSYVHKDDETEGGRISRLARDVVAQYELLTGESIELFLDKDAIEWGEKWRERIDASLASVAFFIPVLTPRYFFSTECRRELQFFARKATALGIKERSAYRNLAEEASRLADLRISEHQVERWAEAGLLPLPDRHGRGRRRGQRFDHPEGTAAHVARLAVAIRRHRSLALATLAGFAGGLPIRERALRRSYTEGYAKFRNAIEERAGVGAGETISRDTAVWIGGPLTERPSRSPTVKALKQRLREVGRGGALSDVVGTGVAVAMGLRGAGFHPDALVAAIGEEPTQDLARWLGKDDPLSDITSSVLAGLPFSKTKKGPAPRPNRQQGDTLARSEVRPVLLDARDRSTRRAAKSSSRGSGSKAAVLAAAPCTSWPLRAVAERGTHGRRSRRKRRARRTTRPRARGRTRPTA